MTNKTGGYSDTSAIDAEIAAAEAALAVAKSGFSSTLVANPTVSRLVTEPATEIAEASPKLVRQFNRQTFFAGYKKSFGNLTQSQVEGLNFLLSSLEQDAELPYWTYMAYRLATLKHETANTFASITEYGRVSYFNKYDPVLANLVNNPELALDPAIAYKIMSYGMCTGVFTGKKLSDYLSKNKADYYSARRIINSLDRASTIKSYAICFEKKLKNSISH